MSRHAQIPLLEGDIVPLLESVRVCQAYHKESAISLQVLDDVNFTLHKNEIVGFLGRSGSGKSTLLRILAGLVAPTSGEILWQGKPLAVSSPDIAMVFQSFALLPWLTVEEKCGAGAGSAKCTRYSS